MTDNTLPYKEMVSNIQKELETYLEKSGLQSLVLGISGGIDSALCAALARPVCDKLGIQLIGRSIPITTNASEERDRAELVGNAFCTNFDESYQVEGAFGATWAAIKEEGWDVENPNEKIRMGNVKARMRMITLYDLAQIHKGMVLSTDNYTELLLGFWTLHGDVGDYGMVQNLWKHEVYDMAEYLVTTFEYENQRKALQACIDCQATDGLGISNTDLDQIMPGWTGSSRDGYAKVDQILSSFLLGDMEFEGKPIYENPVVKRHLATNFKRSNPFNIKRSTILPPPEKEFEKTMIQETVHEAEQNRPYTVEDLDKLNLQKGDQIDIQFKPTGWTLIVRRVRLETDEEFNQRVQNEKDFDESEMQSRYQDYQILKKEFET